MMEVLLNRSIAFKHPALFFSIFTLLKNIYVRWAGEHGLECARACFWCGWLGDHRRGAINPCKDIWRHPATCIAIYACVVYVDVSRDVLRARLLGCDATRLWHHHVMVMEKVSTQHAEYNVPAFLLHLTPQHLVVVLCVTRMMVCYQNIQPAVLYSFVLPEHAWFETAE